MSAAAMLRRLARLEARDDGGLLIFTHERAEPDGSLVLLSDRTMTGEVVEVARIPPHEVERHRRAVIRIKRSYLPE